MFEAGFFPSSSVHLSDGNGSEGKFFFPQNLLSVSYFVGHFLGAF